MQGYEYLAKTLKGYGVTHVYYTQTIFRLAINEMNKLGITSVLAHSENAAGYMADGYARASGRPGICMSQSIGAANLLGGIHDAFLANSPVIALTGKKSPVYQYKNCYQESDHRLMYEGVTKFNAEMQDPQQVGFLIRQAFREATTLKARPVHIDVPDFMGTALEMAEIKDGLFIDEMHMRYPSYRTPAEEGQVEKAAAAIGKAKKPVIVAGRGAAVSGAGSALYELAKKADIPIVTSPDGKGLIDERDPLWAGIVGAYGIDCGNKTAKSADLVIFVGTQTSDQTTSDWSMPARDVKVIHIDVDPTELGKNYPGTIGLLGDARTIAEQLSAAASKATRPEWRAEVSGYVKAMEDEYNVLKASDSIPMRPDRLCAELNKVLPDDAILVADTGFSAVWCASMLRLKSTQSFYRAAGSLGWAFPAAMGAKCAVPDRPVICFAGDGAAYYHIAEMETAVRKGIKTVTIVNNNQVLGQTSRGLRGIYKDNWNESATHYTFAPVSFSKVAAEFGAFALRVEDPAQVAAAVQKALDQDKPALIEVVTDKDAYVPPSLKA